MTVQVWWASLTAAGERLEALLDDAELARAGSLSRHADRGRSMLGAALLRVAVAADLGVEPMEVRVDRTCTECGGVHGAPRIERPVAPARWVSVSHSGLLAVVAVSAHGPVGVDVQRCSDLDDPAASRDWVSREALLKADGPATGADRAPAATDPKVRSLDAPLDGYVAALAASPAGIDHASRHWVP
jgi:4'-phosphopantetheinyl transferase